VVQRGGEVILARFAADRQQSQTLSQ
jgi:hypothetical protein